MTEVKPWEPVSYCWTALDGVPIEDGIIHFQWNAHDQHDDTPVDEGDVIVLSLANSQRVIVRALSEERKAARAMRKRVNKAVEANR